MMTRERVYKNNDIGLFFLEEIFYFPKKEKAPRYSAGQLYIAESKSANNQTLQKGDLYDII